MKHRWIPQNPALTWCVQIQKKKHQYQWIPYFPPQTYVTYTRILHRPGSHHRSRSADVWKNDYDDDHDNNDKDDKDNDDNNNEIIKNAHPRLILI